MVVAQPAHELLHVALGARVEPGGRLVEQEEDRRGQEGARDRHLLLHPARHLLQRAVQPVLVDAQLAHHAADGRARGRALQAVEPHRVEQVLQRRELLEEARLHRDTVDQALDLRLLAHHVVPEDADVPLIGDQQRRDQADQRRLARAVGAEHAVDLVLRDRQADRVDRDDRLLLGRAARRRRLRRSFGLPGPGPLLPGPEALGHAVDDDRRAPGARLGQVDRAGRVRRQGGESRYHRAILPPAPPPRAPRRARRFAGREGNKKPWARIVSIHPRRRPLGRHCGGVSGPSGG